MAEEKVEVRDINFRQVLPWTELFRGFQVALDPKKLLLAAAGILLMAIGWWLWAFVFFSSQSMPKWNDTKYQDISRRSHREGEDPEARGEDPRAPAGNRTGRQAAETGRDEEYRDHDRVRVHGVTEIEDELLDQVDLRHHVPQPEARVVRDDSESPPPCPEKLAKPGADRDEDDQDGKEERLGESRQQQDIAPLLRDLSCLGCECRQ